MPSYELDGRMRAQLREAVLLGFQSRGQLKQVVGAVSRDLDKVVANAPYEEQVDELITVAFGGGWLIELCRELVRERPDYPEVQRSDCGGSGLARATAGQARPGMAEQGRRRRCRTMPIRGGLPSS